MPNLLSQVGIMKKDENGPQTQQKRKAPQMKGMEKKSFYCGKLRRRQAKCWHADRKWKLELQKPKTKTYNSKKIRNHGAEERVHHVLRMNVYTQQITAASVYRQYHRTDKNNSKRERQKRVATSGCKSKNIGRNIWNEETDIRLRLWQPNPKSAKNDSFDNSNSIPSQHCQAECRTNLSARKSFNRNNSLKSNDCFYSSPGRTFSPEITANTTTNCEGRF